MGEDAATHYEKITDIWKEFMGDNFHFGYFESGDEDLDQAAEMMIEKLLQPCDLNEQSRILDVGCGIGGPALYIHERHGCAIDGISTSERGVRIANQASSEKGYDRVRFKVADGMDNGFPDNTFDLVWIMEASHPIADKKALFSECYRVLKQGGMLAMCDLVQLKVLPLHKSIWRLITNMRAFLFGANVWGPAQILTMGNLCDRLIEAGFSRVRSLDITAKVLPTTRRWRESALEYRGGERDEASGQYLDDFVTGCDNLEDAYTEGLMGYGMLFALKES